MPMTVNKSDYYKVVENDDDPDTSFMDEEGHEETKKKWLNVELGCVGVQAEITLQIPCHNHYIEQTITSPGIWGVFVETRDDQYLEELFNEESEILTDMLTAIGIIVVD